MLGWDISVRRKIHEENHESQYQIAEWTTGVYGLKWIDNLVKSNEAVLLEDTGYPTKFAIKASLFRKIIEDGIPENDSPQVIGTDYYLPPGFNSKLNLNAINLDAIPDDEEVILIAFDLS